MGFDAMVNFCRDCYNIWGQGSLQKHRPPSTCSNCLSVRVLNHAEILDLNIAHIDCDAFYASVEKRDHPPLQGKPVIVGGGHRGVVAACCYVARIKGVRSAMPMFRAMKLCPEAVVISPNMKKYRVVGSQIRRIMESVTPIVEPLSIDEAFLDLTGTTRLHGACPAQTLAKLMNKIENEIGITVSVGLSYNKFLAKIASDLDKPRGFSLIGSCDAEAFLEEKPVSIIWGIGIAFQKKMEKDGIETVGDIKKISEKELINRYGEIGRNLLDFSMGIDRRPVSTRLEAKSLSAEKTFVKNLSSFCDLSKELWILCEKVSKRLKASDLACLTLVLKLRLSNFKVISRSKTLSAPTQMAEELYRNGLHLFKKEADGQSFRLVGVAATNLKATEGQLLVDSLDPEFEKQRRVEEAMDNVRGRFGHTAIIKGRGL